MTRYTLAVCKGSDCRRNGADAVYQRAQATLAGDGLASVCELKRGGCYGLCHLGPNVVVRPLTGAPKDPFSREDFSLINSPGETYYWAMNAERVDRVLREHLRDDRVAADLVGDPAREADFRNKT